MRQSKIGTRTLSHYRIVAYLLTLPLLFVASCMGSREEAPDAHESASNEAFRQQIIRAIEEGASDLPLEYSRMDLAIVDLDGNVLQRLTDNDAVEEEPRMSPDGTRIAFVMGGNLWLMPSEGGEYSPLTEVEGLRIFGLAWSTDSNRIAFDAHTRGGPKDTDVFLVAVDTRATMNLTSTPATDEYSPRWHPDQDVLLYHSSREWPKRLTVHDLATDERTDLQVPLPDGSWICDAVWTADGAEVLLSVSVRGKLSLGLYDLASSQYKQVVPPGVAWHSPLSSVSADGSVLVYQAVGLSAWKMLPIADSLKLIITDAKNPDWVSGTDTILCEHRFSLLEKDAWMRLQKESRDVVIIRRGGGIELKNDAFGNLAPVVLEKDATKRWGSSERFENLDREDAVAELHRVGADFLDAESLYSDDTEK